MTLEEAKKVATDPLGRYTVTTVIDAARVLAAALGEPSPEDREAAGHFRRLADVLAQSIPFTGSDPVMQAHAEEQHRRDMLRAARYRRAAEALSRSPAAIRRAVLNEAESAVEACERHNHEPAERDPNGRVIYRDEALKAIRALDGGAR